MLVAKINILPVPELFDHSVLESTYQSKETVILSPAVKPVMFSSSVSQVLFLVSNVYISFSKPIVVASS